MSNSKEYFSTPRIEWIDYAKGLGIFLVVLGHTLRGLVDSIEISSSAVSILHDIDAWIYTFHMPLFFFLSGIFAKYSISKNCYEFFLNKFSTILYPYFVWSFIVGTLIAVSGVQEEFYLRKFMLNLWRILYQPIDIFWFLHTLFLISFAYFIIRKCGVSPVFVLLLSVTLFLLNSNYSVFQAWDSLNKVAGFSIFFVIGSFFNPNSSLLNVKNYILLVCSIAGFMLIALFVKISFISVAEEFHFIFSLLGILSCVAMSLFLSRSGQLPFVRTWGLFSLQIYVAHTAFAALTRVGIQEIFGVNSFPVITVLAVVSGIYFPILLQLLTQKIKINFLFNLPIHYSVKT